MKFDILTAFLALYRFMSQHRFTAQKNRKLRSIALVLIALSLLSCQIRSSKKQDIDFARLTEELKAQNWRSADAETLQLLLKISDRADEGWLNKTDVEKLDCAALVQIDRLWTEHSKGKFGFSQQRLIWLSVGGTVGRYNPQIAEKFGDRVGWRDRRKWQIYDKLDFSTQAPQGHLPAITGNGVSGSVWGGVAAIGKRLQYCSYNAVDRVPIALARNEYYAGCDRNSREQRCLLKKAAERWGDTPDWGGKGLPQLFDRLEQTLANKQWIEADKITKTLFDRYRQASFAEFRQSDSHEVIPCYLLKAADDLWMRYSQGRFGLSAQASVLAEKKILPLKQASPGYEIATASYIALGWNRSSPSANDSHRVHRPYNSAFDAVEPQRIPKGYYPYDMGYSYYTYGSGYVGEWRFYLNPACGFN